MISHFFHIIFPFLLLFHQHQETSSQSYHVAYLTMSNTNTLTITCLCYSARRDMLDPQTSLWIPYSFPSFLHGWKRPGSIVSNRNCHPLPRHHRLGSVGGHGLTGEWVSGGRGNGWNALPVNTGAHIVQSKIQIRTQIQIQIQRMKCILERRGNGQNALPVNKYKHKYWKVQCTL